MRKVVFIFLVLAAGCRKAEDLTDNQSTPPAFAAKSQTAPPIECRNGMLHFADMDEVRRTLALLEAGEAEHLNAFVAKYGHLDEAGFNKAVEGEGFVEEQPLMDFEGLFPCYGSLRQKIAADEEAWLAHEELDEATDPDNHFVDDEYVRTILNAEGQVRIGDSVYVHAERCYGSYHFKTFTGKEKPKCLEEKGGIVCKSNRRTPPSFESNPSNKKERTKMMVSHMTYPWGRFVTARLKNYKKIGCCWHLAYHHGWSIAKVYGFISGASGDCNAQANFNPNGTSQSGQYSKKVRHRTPVETLTSSGWVKGDMRGINGSSKTKILIFTD